jgi:pimeloyl-ACP methyl ester carboxylesterase
VIEPIVFGDALRPLFGALTRPPSQARDTGVVICAPMGYENGVSYRGLHALAGRLAESGRPTLRFDWPSIGDSSGDHSDAGLVEAWIGAVGEAVSELRELTGVVDVALVGVRLGATLAVAAAARGAAVSELVLWAPFLTGRSYVRQMRAFHAIAERSISPPRDDGSPRSQNGDVEASGYLLSATTVRDLDALDLSALRFPEPRPCRVLYAGGNSREDSVFLEQLTAQGIASEAATLKGLDSLIDNWQDAAVPEASVASILGWLSPGSQTLLRPRKPVNAPQMSLEISDAVVDEEFVGIGPSDDQCLAVLTTCRQRAPGPGATWVVFVNSGGARRSGPNRMWTMFARRWASRGIPSLRLDVRGAGDSDGVELASLDSMYAPSVVDDVISALAFLRRQRGAGQFVVAGLCSGAYASFQAAIRQSDVMAALLVNPLEIFSSTSREASAARPYDRVSPFARGRIGRLARGEVAVRTVARFAGRSAAVISDRSRERLSRRFGGSSSREEVAAAIVGGVRHLSERGSSLLIVHSAGDASIDYLRWHLGAQLPEIESLPGVQRRIISGADHIFRPLPSQARLQQTFEDQLVACGLNL